MLWCYFEILQGGGEERWSVFKKKNAPNFWSASNPLRGIVCVARITHMNLVCTAQHKNETRVIKVALFL